MKTATRVIGIIVAFFLYVGTAFKLVHFPFTNVLLLFGSLVLVVGYLPVLLGYQLTQSKRSVLFKMSSVFGLFAGWTITIGILYTILSWPNAEFNMLLGYICLAVFLALYFIMLVTDKSGERKFGAFTLLTALLFVPLFVCLVAVKPYKEKKKDYLILDSRMDAPQRLAMKKKDSLYTRFERLLAQDEGKYRNQYDKAFMIRKNTEELVHYIRDIRAELIEEEMHVDHKCADTFKMKEIDRFTDFDTPTHFLVGSNPERPTGKGIQLKEKMEQYRKVLAEVTESKIKISGLETDPITDSDGQKVEWITAKFYHSEFGNTLLILKDLEIKIRTAEYAALESVIME